MSDPVFNPNPRGILFDHIVTALRPEKAVLWGLSTPFPTPLPDPTLYLIKSLLFSKNAMISQQKRRYFKKQ